MISGCLLVLLLCQTVTAFFGSGAFDMFQLMSGPVQKPACIWDMDHRVPEATPLGKEGICLDNLPTYDQIRIDIALERDSFARSFLRTVKRLYQPMNQTYFSQVTYGGQTFDYEDMCPVNPSLVHRVNVPDPRTGAIDICNVVNPYEQNIYRAECGMNCQMNGQSAVNHFCVPDGYIERYALVFCPSSMVQCRPARIKIPVGCSCKKYTCLKYLK
ncbi:hypothetical protein LOTGIDRAFT_154423 [Lottia gigantea]|uniref:Spaetzle domain-containing protein n=1 Tax=Lottia gigantea TaxID=225164 RepID=V3ZY26_LOTGI|nr:hypothetical protein LOTGIDRAFT_154423 [Lottia gigantea]ESO89322.1 hypothetical protein LOTGIDRAFT_154423 [Lottia gigantea]